MKDLIILGNGMAGMTAALYAKRANLDFKIVGKDEFNFGQIGNAISVENYPCAAGLSGFDLAMNLYNQLEANDVQIEEHEIVSVQEAYGPKSIPYIIKYADGATDVAKSVIYALGAAPRKLDCEIEEGIPIHYCALCDGPLYKDKTVAIIGGGDVAFTQAEYLSKICKEVKIIMCDENITAAPSTVKRIRETDNITIYFNRPIAKISHPTDGSYMLWSNNVRGAALADGIFVAIGMKPNIIPLDTFRCWDENGYIITDSECRTKHKGLFAAGDIRQKQVRQAITAAADGAIAVQSAISYLKEA